MDRDNFVILHNLSTDNILCAEIRVVCVIKGSPCPGLSGPDVTTTNYRYRTTPTSQ